MERRYERKQQGMGDIQTPNAYMAFRSRRSPEVVSSFHVKEHKVSPFKQMVQKVEESVTEKPRLHPRLYNRIVDSIYTYTKGIHDSSHEVERQGPYERLMVTPVTAKDDHKDDAHRHSTYFPPIM